jgi:hypothetical protein
MEEEVRQMARDFIWCKEKGFLGGGKIEKSHRITEVFNDQELVRQILSGGQ